MKQKILTNKENLIAKCIKHEPCPQCGSRDNLGRYEDGSAWCFGCGYWERAERTVASLGTLFQDKRKVSDGGIELPPNLSETLTIEQQLWLNKYNLTQKEIKENDILCSNTALVFVCSIGDKVIGYQSREFPEGKPKYKTKGNAVDMSMSVLCKESTDLGSSKLFFVEDRISAIKVSRCVPTVPLFGSHLATELLERVKNQFTSFGLWLDPDKRKSAFKQCLNLKQKGFNIYPVFSDKDPKEHTDEEIKQILLL